MMVTYQLLDDEERRTLPEAAGYLMLATTGTTSHTSMETHGTFWTFTLKETMTFQFRLFFFAKYFRPQWTKCRVSSALFGHESRQRHASSLALARSISSALDHRFGSTDVPETLGTNKHSRLGQTLSFTQSFEFFEFIIEC